MWRYGTHTFGVRSTAVALSLSVHAGLFWQYAEEIWPATAAVEGPVIVARLSLPAPLEAPAHTKPPTPRAEMKPLVETKPIAKPIEKTVVKIKPTQTLALAEPARSEAIAEAIVQIAEPELAEEVEAIQDPVSERTEEVGRLAQPMALALAQPAAPVSAEPTLEEVVENLQHYLAELRAAIAAQKQYPAMARRRGIEGEVKVSFTLLADGNVRDLQVSGGPRPLRKAARQAVHRALKLPSPPEGVPLPMPVQYAMNFTLE